MHDLHPQLTLRDGCPHDLARILELRARQERPLIGRVPLRSDMKWIVAEKDGVIVACGGAIFSKNEEGGTRVTVCEFYDDGSLSGKRGLIEILRDSAEANVDLYAIIPSDRPGLMKALASHGLEVTGMEMSRRANPRAE